MTPDYLQVRVFSIIDKPGIQKPYAELAHTAILTPDRRASMISEAPFSRRLLFAVGPAIQLFVPLDGTLGENKLVRLDEII